VKKIWESGGKDVPSTLRAHFEECLRSTKTVLDTKRKVFEQGGRSSRGEGKRFKKNNEGGFKGGENLPNNCSLAWVYSN